MANSVWAFSSHTNATFMPLNDLAAGRIDV